MPCISYADCICMHTQANIFKKRVHFLDTDVYAISDTTDVSNQTIFLTHYISKHTSLLQNDTVKD